ncbi:MAG: phosphate ABC transporter, permease protein PstA, partial [Marmoricola sp.]
MTTLLDEPTTSLEHVPLRHARLPKWAPLLVVVLALAASALVGLLRGWGPAAIVVVALLLYLVALPLWSRVVENRRSATDRFVTGLVWVALGLAFVPLISLLWTVVGQGLPVLDAKFFTWSMRNIIGEKGGIFHAIIGTLLITGAAALISVPIGLLSAIYLVEYGGKSRLASSIRFLVDVMTGIPSIVAGLFAYALFVLFFGPGVHIGLGGAVALSLLMIPI